jgi:hypothetical protein
MKTPKHLIGFLFFVFCLLISTSVSAQNCPTGAEVTAPAGGSIAAAASLTVYNSTEAGADSAAARTAVDLQDDAWRSGVLTNNLGNGFITATNTVTPQSTVNVPQNNIFLISTFTIGYDYRDIPLNFRTVAAPCVGSTIATTAERVAFLAKTATMQGGENAPRPASLYNTANQPLVYDEIQASAQPNRINSANAVVFTFSAPVKGFGAWFGDVETRTVGGGDPAVVRLLDASGNRIGSDVLIQPTAGSQAGCGNSNVGCGNQSTRWLGFTDTNAAARVKQMVVIVGFQGGTSSWGDQRISFIGPTLPITFTAAPANLSGRVTTAEGAGIRNARVTLTSFDSQQTRTVITNSFGYYSFADVPVGTTYLLAARAKGITFTPDTQVITMLDEISDADFTAQELR